MSHIGMSEEKYNYVLKLTKALWRVTDLFSCNDVLARLLREKASEIFSCAVEFGYSDQYEREQEILKAKISLLLGFLELARLEKTVKPINIIFLSKEYGELQHVFEQEFKSKISIKETKIPPNLPFAKGGDEREIIPPNLPFAKGGDEREIIPPSLSPIKSGINSLQKGAASGAVYPRVKEGRNKQSLKQLKIKKEKDNNPQPIRVSIKENNNLNDRQKTIIAHIKEVPQAKVSDFYEILGKISTKTVQRDLQDLVDRSFLRKEGEKRWTTYSIIQ